MKRTNWSVWICLCLPVAPGRAQQSPEKAQETAVNEVVASVRAAEASLSSVRLRMTTRFRQLEDLLVTTRGELRVLRGTQPDAARTYTEIEYENGDGGRGRLAASRTPDGMLVYEEDPAWGPVFVQISAAQVADLEWAGKVLGRSDLYGMADGRASTPLGSGVLEDLQHGFVLRVDERTEHEGVAGTWLAGPARKALDDEVAELPVAEQVEAFVRGSDRAVMLVRFSSGGQTIQDLVVEHLEVDPELGDDAFAVDGHGVRVRDVREHKPMWAVMEDVLQDAEAKAYAAARADDVERSEEEDLAESARPSRRAALREKLDEKSSSPGEQPGGGR